VAGAGFLDEGEDGGLASFAVVVDGLSVQEQFERWEAIKFRLVKNLFISLTINSSKSNVQLSISCIFRNFIILRCKLDAMFTSR
jgi:hypothetical protein